MMSYTTARRHEERAHNANIENLTEKLRHLRVRTARAVFERDGGDWALSPVTVTTDDGERYRLGTSDRLPEVDGLDAESAELPLVDWVPEEVEISFLMPIVHPTESGWGFELSRTEAQNALKYLLLRSASLKYRDPAFMRGPAIRGVVTFDSEKSSIVVEVEEQ